MRVKSRYFYLKYLNNQSVHQHVKENRSNQEFLIRKIFSQFLLPACFPVSTFFFFLFPASSYSKEPVSSLTCKSPQAFSWNSV